MLIFLIVTILTMNGPLSYEVRESNWTLEECETAQLNFEAFMMERGIPKDYYRASCVAYPPADEFVKVAA